ncbi:MAG TPA: hypothetical protein VF221_09315 [Chloroflexota bacterium]
MTWIDEVRVELERRQPRQASPAQTETTDEAATQAGRLVRRLLQQMNEELLEGHGSVWETHVRWGVRLWELWWGGTRTEGQYILVTLLRDSRGTPYLRVQRRRLALQDPMLERRLQRALQSAFLQPGIYEPRAQTPAEIQDSRRPNTQNSRGERSR